MSRRWGRRGGRGWHGSAARRRERARSRDAGDIGTEAKFLEAQGVDFARGCQAVGGLKFLHGVDGVGVPFAIGIAVVVAAARERGLDLGNACGSGSFLGGLAPGIAMPVRRSSFFRSVGRRGCGCGRARRLRGLGSRGRSGGDRKRQHRRRQHQNGRSGFHGTQRLLAKHFRSMLGAGHRVVASRLRRQ